MRLAGSSLGTPHCLIPGKCKGQACHQQYVIISQLCCLQVLLSLKELDFCEGERSGSFLHLLCRGSLAPAGLSGLFKFRSNAWLTGSCTAAGYSLHTAPGGLLRRTRKAPYPFPKAPHQHCVRSQGDGPAFSRVLPFLILKQSGRKDSEVNSAKNINPFKKNHTICNCDTQTV